MRVALVTKPDRQMTGLRRYSESLVQGLRTLRADVATVYPQPIPRWAARLGRLARLDAEAFFSSYPLRVRVDGYDVCHLSSQTLATLLLWQRLPPTVVTVHDIIPHLVQKDPALGGGRRLADRLCDGLALRGLRRARALIAISQFTKGSLVEALGYPPERIHVVYRAVDRDVFRPLEVPEAFRARHGVTEGQPTVLYVGSEDPRKNLALLVRAFLRVRAALPQAVLLKVGEAQFRQERQALQRLVAELGLQASVRFVDEVADEELPLFYNAADALVLPSLYEGFGLPALEAMSCGTPVIAANRASLPEVVGKGGVLVDAQDEAALAERIVELLTDPQRRAAARQAALEQAQRFSLRRQAEDTWAVYEGIR